MPTSFKTGGRTPAGCAEARRPNANGDKHNANASKRITLRPLSFDLCSLHPNILYLPLSMGAQASLPACFGQSVLAGARRQGCLRSQDPSMLLGWNLLLFLLRLLFLRLSRLSSRLLSRLSSRLLSRLLSWLLSRLLVLSRNLDHPPGVRAGVEHLAPHRLSLLQLFGDCGRRQRGQPLLGDHIFRAVDRNARDSPRLINPAETVDLFVRFIAHTFHIFKRKQGGLVLARRALEHRLWRQLAFPGLDLSRGLLLFGHVEFSEAIVQPLDDEEDEGGGYEQNGQKHQYRFRRYGAAFDLLVLLTVTVTAMAMMWIVFAHISNPDSFTIFHITVVICHRRRSAQAMTNDNCNMENGK